MYSSQHKLWICVIDERSEFSDVSRSFMREIISEKNRYYGMQHVAKRTQAQPTK